MEHVSDADVLTIVGMIIDEDESIMDLADATEQAAYLLGLDPDWVYSLAHGETGVAEEEYQLGDRWDQMSDELTRDEMYARAMESRIRMNESLDLVAMSKAEVLRTYFDQFGDHPRGVSYNHYVGWAAENGVSDKVASRPFYNKVKQVKMGKSPHKAKPAPKATSTPEPAEKVGTVLKQLDPVRRAGYAINALGEELSRQIHDITPKVNERYGTDFKPAQIPDRTGLKLMHIPPGEGGYTDPDDGADTIGILLDLPRELRHPDEYPSLDLEHDDPPRGLIPYIIADRAAGVALDNIEQKYRDEPIQVEMMADLPWTGGRPIGRRISVSGKWGL